MFGDGVSVIAWQAQGCGSLADEAANQLYYLLRDFTLPHAVNELCQYSLVKGSSDVL